MILLAFACGGGEVSPVPAHPDLTAVRAAVVDEDAAALTVALQPFRVQPDRLGPAGAEWATVTGEAGDLALATVRSERNNGYARLAVACSFCHVGQPAPTTPINGHGQAIVALEEGVRFGSQERFKQARAALAQSPDLPDSIRRFNQLAGRIAEAPDPGQSVRFLTTLYNECVRCHGASSPLKLGE